MSGKIKIAALLAAIAAAGAAICAGLNPSFAPLAVLGAITVILALAAAASAEALKRPGRELYAYTNIVLIGLGIFAAVFAAASGVFFVRLLISGNYSGANVFRMLLRFPRHFSYYAMFAIIAVSVLVGVSNVSLIKHEGFCASNALSLVIAAFYIGGTVLVFVVTGLLERYVFTENTVAAHPVLMLFRFSLPLFLLAVLCYLECVFAGAVILGYKAARRIPAHDKDYVIILGCSIDKRGGLLPLLKGRVNRAVRFAWEQEIDTGKPVKYVPSGGQGENEIMSEGSAMELYLLTRGAESYEVFPEKKSRTTRENLLFSKNLIDSMKPGAKVAFATTNYHILRSGILARELGLDAEGIAGDTKWYFWPNGFIREFFAILAMKKRAHLIITAVLAVLSALTGLVGYLCGF